MDLQQTGYSTNSLEQNLSGEASCPSGDEELSHPWRKPQLTTFHNFLPPKLVACKVNPVHKITTYLFKI